MHATFENIKEGTRLIGVKNGKEYEVVGCQQPVSEKIWVVVVREGKTSGPSYHSAIKNFRLK